MYKLAVEHYRTIVPTTLKFEKEPYKSYARSTMVPACASTLTFMKKRFSIAKSIVMSRLSEPTHAIHEVLGAHECGPGELPAGEATAVEADGEVVKHDAEVVHSGEVHPLREK